MKKQLSLLLVFFLCSLSIEARSENPGTYITASNYTHSATEKELDNACSNSSPTLSAEGSIFDKILMSKLDLFVIYPNPARDYIKIKWPSKANNIEGSSFIFVLYDMAGTEVKRVQISKEITDLSLENLSADIYAYKIFLNDETKIEYNKGLITIVRD